MSGVSSAGKSTVLEAMDADQLADRLPAAYRRLPPRIQRVALLPLAGCGFALTPRSVPGIARTLVWAYRRSVIRRPRDRVLGLVNAWQHMGLLLLARRRAGGRLLLDTGTVHTVYNFFVDPEVPPDLAVVREYLQRIPLADQVVIVTADRDVVIERTLGRSNRRTQGMTRADAERFHDHALLCLEQTMSVPRTAAIAEWVTAASIPTR